MNVDKKLITGEILKETYNRVVNSKSVTYSELVDLRDSEQLIPGQQYKITDYKTMVNSDDYNIMSTEQEFEIVVTAISAKEISEDAVAVIKQESLLGPGYLCWKSDNADDNWIITSENPEVGGDILGYCAFDITGSFDIVYEGNNREREIVEVGSDFIKTTWRGDDSKTDTWYQVEAEIAFIDIKYTLDNISKWADPDGMGVITQMIDSDGNECPYDFKSIKIYDSYQDEYVYTFDSKAGSACQNNVIKQSSPTFDICIVSDGDICDNKIINSHHIYLFNSYKPATITNSCFLSNVEFEEDYQEYLPGSIVSYNKVTGLDWYEEGTEVGDIWVFDDETEEKFFIKPEELEDYSDSRYIPIGVCCIPSSHNIYGDGSAGVVSLKYMSLSTPNTGNIESSGIYWGQHGVDISNKLPHYDKVNSQSKKLELEAVNHAALPSEIFDGGISGDLSTRYSTNTNFPPAPSPYLPDGSRNVLYSVRAYSSKNALSDFSGKTNTEKLCTLATAQSNWKTASTITNNYRSGYSPAACCCWRYSTPGTNQGEWWLPSAGELGYIEVKQKTISDSLKAIRRVKGNNYASDGLSDSWYWSSTNFSAGGARSVYFGYGDVYDYAKNDVDYVRAVCSSLS